MRNKVFEVGIFPLSIERVVIGVEKPEEVEGLLHKMKRAFTLIELLIIITIVGILAATLLVARSSPDAEVSGESPRDKETPEEICERKGGVPLGSDSFGRINDCKFPPIGGGY